MSAVPLDLILCPAKKEWEEEPMDIDTEEEPMEVYLDDNDRYFVQLLEKTLKVIVNNNIMTLLIVYVNNRLVNI